MADIVFVIPAYNEGANIGQLLEGVDAASRLESSGRCRVLVGDDGSTDQTPQILRDFARHIPLESVRHPVNLGAGRAFLSGFKRALEVTQPDDIIVTMEADNTGDWGILPRMIQQTRNGCDIALASCYVREGRVEGTTWWRQILSRTANGMLRIVCPIPGVRTYSSFYRAYRQDILRRAMEMYGDDLIRERGFTCMLELLMKLQTLKPRITEIPMILRCQLRKGKSKMKVGPTIAAYFRLMGRHLLKRDVWSPRGTM